MDIRKIENRLSRMGQEHEENVDTQALWSQVSQELDGKKKRPIFIWIFVGVVVGNALLVGLGVYNFSNNGNEEIVGSLYLPESNLVKSDITDADRSVISRNKEPQEFSNENQEINSQSIAGEIDNSLKMAKSNVRNITNYSSSDLGAGRKSNYTIQGIDYKLMTPSSMLLSDIDLSNNDYSVGLDKLWNGAIGDLQTNKFEINLGNVGEVFVQSPDQNKVQSDLETNPGDSKKVHESSLQRFDINITPLKLPGFFELLPEKTSFYPRSSNRWRLGIFGGILSNSISLASISRDGGSGESASFLKRKSSIAPLVSVEIGVEMSYRVSKQLYIVSGLQYRNISLRSSSELFSTENILQDGIVIERIIGPDGVEEILGQGLVTRETRSSRVRISNYKELSIPLYIEYSTESSLLNPFIGIGVDHSFLLSRSGLIHLSDEDEYSIDLDKDGLFSSNLGLSLNVYGGLRIRATKSTFINSRIGFRKELFSQFNSQSTISEKHSMVRLQIGIERQF